MSKVLRTTLLRPRCADPFDWVGNRLNPPADPNPMEYNAADQLTRWPSNHEYTYYDTGSLYEQWGDGMTTLQKTYQYTAANLLMNVTHEDVSGDPVSEMEWDADGNRVSFTSSTGGTYDFVYDPTAGIPAMIEEDKPLGPVYYIREPGGELIARLTSAGALRYYHFDALGSTRLLTDEDGDVTDEYVYDAWGRQVDHTGDTAQPFRFVGQLGYYSPYQDANLFTENAWQLLHLGVRFYDTRTGQFTQADPVADGLNWYAYVKSTPAQETDPSGLGKGRTRVGKGDHPLWEAIRELLCQGKTTKQIEDALVKKGWDRNVVKEMLRKCGKQHGFRNVGKRGKIGPGGESGRKGCGGPAYDTATACFLEDPEDFMWLVCGDEHGCSGYSPPRDVIGDIGKQIGDMWDRIKDCARRYWPF